MVFHYGRNVFRDLLAGEVAVLFDRVQEGVGAAVDGGEHLAEMALGQLCGRWGRAQAGGEDSLGELGQPVEQAGGEPALARCGCDGDRHGPIVAGHRSRRQVVVSAGVGFVSGDKRGG